MCVGGDTRVCTQDATQDQSQEEEQPRDAHLTTLSAGMELSLKPTYSILITGHGPACRCLVTCAAAVSTFLPGQGREALPEDTQHRVAD